MAMSTDNRQKAIQLVEQLPEDSLSHVIEMLNFLLREANQTKVLFPTKSEAELLQVIYRKLLQEEQARLDYLREQNQSGDITELEHLELLDFVDRIENQDAARAAAILTLAQIRKVEPLSLIKEFATPIAQNHAI